MLEGLGQNITLCVLFFVFKLMISTADSRIHLFRRAERRKVANIVGVFIKYVFPNVAYARND